MARSSLHTLWERDRQVTWGFRYTSWLLVALPKVRFRNTALTILIHLSLAPTSLQLFLIPIHVVTHLPMRHVDKTVSNMAAPIVV